MVKPKTRETNQSSLQTAAIGALEAICLDETAPAAARAQAARTILDHLGLLGEKPKQDQGLSLGTREDILARLDSLKP